MGDEEGGLQIDIYRVWGGLQPCDNGDSCVKHTSVCATHIANSPRSEKTWAWRGVANAYLMLFRRQGNDCDEASAWCTTKHRIHVESAERK